MKLNSALLVLTVVASALGSNFIRAARADGTSDLAYYQQFEYSTTTDADGNVTGRTLQNPAIDLNAAGSVIASVDIYLLPNGTYVLDYSEMQSNGFPIVMMQNYFGTWSVPGGELLLGDVATGTRATDQGQNAVQLTFLKDLNTPGLSGKSVVVDLGFTNIPVPTQSQ